MQLLSSVIVNASAAVRFYFLVSQTCNMCADDSLIVSSRWVALSEWLSVILQPEHTESKLDHQKNRAGERQVVYMQELMI